MRASFFAMGQGIEYGKDLSVVDMRQIAPTLTQLLGVSLPQPNSPRSHYTKERSEGWFSVVHMNGRAKS
jgi:hypothetical protein